MAAHEKPQIYLVTPPAFEPTDFVPRLCSVLDSFEITCLRLSIAGHNEDHISRAADQLREVTHARDIPIVIENHIGLVERLGLDGVHFIESSAPIRKTRKDLGPDAIIGTYARASKHQGMAAAEAGADYISFGPVGASDLGTTELAQKELFAWWTEMIEVPIVAEGALTTEVVENLCSVVDFFSIGEEIWNTADPQNALTQLIAALK